MNNGFSDRFAAYRGKIEAGAAVVVVIAIAAGIYEIGQLKGSLKSLKDVQLDSVIDARNKTIKEIANQKSAGIAALQGIEKIGVSALSTSTDTKKREITDVRDVALETISTRSDESQRAIAEELKNSLEDGKTVLKEATIQAVAKVLGAQADALKKVSHRLARLADIDMKLDAAVRALGQGRYECDWRDVGYRKMYKTDKDWCPTGHVIGDARTHAILEGGKDLLPIVQRVKCCRWVPGEG